MSSGKTKEIQWQMRALSLRLREEMGWALTEPVHLSALLRRKDILTLLRPLEDNFSGMALRVRDRKGNLHRFMLINTAQSYSKQRFTACHELYHLLFQDDFEVSSNNAGLYDSSQPEEYKADVFAAQLLLPEEGLRSFIPFQETKKDSIRLETIVRIEQNYQCSRATVLRTLKDLQLLSSDRYNQYAVHVIRSAADLGYDLSLYRPTNKKQLLGDYNLKARELFNSGRISWARYQELLDDMGMEREVEDDGE